MKETSARLLRLLSLLQTRPEWPGAELSARLGIARRTVRRDIERLRSLGYPVHSVPGVAGGYRLGAGAAMPPLLLDDEEAVAVAVGLRTAAGGSVEGIEEASLRALAKLEQVLPSRLRHRVTTLHAATATIPDRGPRVSSEVLTALAAACRGRERLRMDYLDHRGATTRREVEPHTLVSWGRRWYLLAYDPSREDWRTFRVDRVTPRVPNGPRYTPREPPAGDAVAYVLDHLGTAMWPVRATVRVAAPAAALAGLTTGLVEPVDDDTCLLTLGGESLHLIAMVIGMLDADFVVVEPAELRGHLDRLAARFTRAAKDPGT